MICGPKFEALNYAEVLEKTKGELFSLEEEIEWAERCLHNCHFTQFELKHLLKYHIARLKEEQLNKMSDTIRAMYKQKKTAEAKKMTHGINKDLDKEA